MLKAAIVAGLAAFMLVHGAAEACSPRGLYYEDCLRNEAIRFQVRAMEAAELAGKVPAPVVQPYEDPRIEVTPEGVTIIRGQLADR